MFRNVFCASLLLTTSVAALAQDKGPSTATADRAVWPYMHECTVTPAPVPTEVTSPIPSIGVVVKKNTHRTAAPPAWDRIDLRFDVATPPPGGTIPTVSGHAINTKGTGANTGRSTKPDGTVAISCTGRALAADAATQKVNMQDFHRGSQGAGWACAVTGSEDAPQFTLKLLVPTAGGQATEWSFGQSNSGHSGVSGHGHGTGRVSIVPRGLKSDDSLRIACSSSTARSKNYDLAVAGICEAPSQSRQQINKSKSNVKNNRAAAGTPVGDASGCNDHQRAGSGAN